ncbi:BTB POZ fold protein [Rutstroemia sp. NJR-2017a BBW]|nr:BTB POZ fold protein [Rutstroemia sp. NJR-2017a BBW]
MSQAQSVIDSITRCFDDDTYSDLTIKCCNRSWKLHREAYTGVIDLDDNDQVSVEIMLKYFYTGIYDETIIEGEELRLQLRTQVLTYNLADKYDVPTLMELTEKKFKSTLSVGPTLEEFLSVISDIYTVPKSTNTLRVIAVEYARTKFRSMMQSADLEILRITIQDVPDFAFDVLQLFINAPLRGHCVSCGPNQSTQALQARCVNCRRGGISLTY